jgi:hypothetical protein
MHPCAAPILILSALSMASMSGCQAIKSGKTATSYPASAAPAAVVAPAPDAPPAATAGLVPPSELHVFLINGADPLRIAGMGKLVERIKQSGYPNTHFAGWYEPGRVEREIRAIHRADPSARFALVGYSAGTYAAKGTAGRLVRDGIPVAMVGYIGGDYLRDTESTRLGGVGRVVNVTGDGYLLTGKNLLFNGTDVRGARNLRLAGTRHFDLPNHPSTFAALIDGLAEAAGSGY